MPAADAVVLIDSVTEVVPAHRGAIVITGSHGGVSAARYAGQVNARLYVLNDAGIGKDDAGVAALALLDARGQAAVAVAHTSARIGDAADVHEHGVISRVNAAAHALGLHEGQRVQDAIVALARGGAP